MEEYFPSRTTGRDNVEACVESAGSQRPLSNHTVESQYSSATGMVRSQAVGVKSNISAAVALSWQA